MPSPKALHPDWRPSQCFALGFWSILLITTGVVMGSAMPLALKTGCLLGLVWQAVYVARRCRPLLTSSGLTDLWWNGQHWCGVWPGGQRQLRWTGAVVRRWLVVLYFRTHGGRPLAVAILPDQLPAAQFRVLRQLALHASLASNDG